MSHETPITRPANITKDRLTISSSIASSQRDPEPTTADPSSVLPPTSTDDRDSTGDTLADHHDDTHPQTLERATTTSSQDQPAFSAFSPNQKRLIVFVAAWAGFFSPVSASIYLPALNALAQDLSVSNSLINLTLTSYNIFQGIAPAFIGNLADTAGRRPAYFVCFTIYIAANIGLALQNDYAALFVLRCLQACGGAPTIAMSSAIVSDIATPAERGKWMGYTITGALLGPALGPVLGGILAQFLSWRAIFWFLVIFAGTFLVMFLIFFPETGRSIVGDGSIPPKGINMSLINYLAVRKAQREATIESEPTETKAVDSELPSRPKRRFPNPLSSLKVVLDRSNALLLFYNAFLFASFYDIVATIPSQFALLYGFNDLQIGLCYIPFGVGSLVAAILNGRLLDWNFRRWCKKLDVVVKRGKDQDLSKFPIEKVRLQIAIPAAYSSALLILIWGWALQYRAPLAAVLVILFFTSFSMSVANTVTSTLLIDFYPRRAAAASAANNLTRCLLGAGATAVVAPMIDGMGLGWTFSFLSFFLLATSPMLWVLAWRGMKWRNIRTMKEEEEERRRDSALSGAAEEGQGSVHSIQDKEIQSSEKGPVEGGNVELTAVIEDQKSVQRLEK